MKSKKLSEFLHKQRTGLGKTQTQIADDIGVLTGQYGKWEREGILPRNPRHRMKLLEALNIDSDSLPTTAARKGSRARSVNTDPPQNAPAGISNRDSEEENLLPLLPIIMESGITHITHADLGILGELQAYFEPLSLKLTPNMVREVLLALRSR